MAVQKILNKRIVKYDTKNPNFKPTPKPKVEVDGNVKDDDLYGEKKYTYVLNKMIVLYFTSILKQNCYNLGFTEGQFYQLYAIFSFSSFLH